ncbi:MAG: sigma-70 family RNA polymerase sigma factor [Clostridiales bacterium]|nr:sigma-70 family RNA polymerase sigma factor [Clostridiales bacterium]
MTTIEFERIYTESYRAVYWTAISLLKNEAEAEDVVQDTFVTLLESYDTLQDKTKVVPWLKKICANKCLNRLSRTKTDTVEDEILENLETVPEDFLPDSIVESDEMRRIVMDIIENALSDDVRRTIILFYFDEMSTKEIAEAMGIPQGTVLWRLNFARKKIKKEVEKYEEENNTKLFAMPLPFLTKLFTKEAEQVALRPMPASLLNLSASSEAALSGAGKQVAQDAIMKGTGTVMKKLIIGVIGLAVVGAAITGAVLFKNRDNDSKDKKKTDRKKNNAIEEIDGENDYDGDGIADGGYDGDRAGADDRDYDDYDGYDDYSTFDTQPAIVNIDDYDWESIYEWEGSKITGIKDPVDEAVKNTGVLVIPERCETIGAYAFGERAWVKEVRFEAPDKITMIEDFAMDQFTHLHSFVMPPNANLMHEGEYFQEGTAPFGNSRMLSSSTKLHNLVLPNGEVTYYYMHNIANYWVDAPVNNQQFLETLYVPGNFSIRYNDPERDAPCFAKYSKEFYDANWEMYQSISKCEEFSSKVCKVYVVEGSWADVNFDSWAAGDLIQKEYWDGVNYTFPEYDPIWDVEEISIYTENGSVDFSGVEENWEVIVYDKDYNHLFEGNLDGDTFEALYHDILALIDSGKVSDELYGTNRIVIDDYTDNTYYGVVDDDGSVVQALIDKYAK